MLELRETEEGVLLPVFVQSKSKKNEIAGIHDKGLRVKVTAPPVEGAANEACRRLLAKMLGVSKSSVEIVKGEKSSRKLVLFKDKGIAELQAIIGRLTGDA
ncbi:MAG: YggU family protein [Deltaproteobacteria bacterium]|nr:YggU family protein [Deltaproteobacteria bacterium]